MSRQINRMLGKKWNAHAHFPTRGKLASCTTNTMQWQKREQHTWVSCPMNCCKRRKWPMQKKPNSSWGFRRTRVMEGKGRLRNRFRMKENERCENCMQLKRTLSSKRQSSNNQQCLSLRIWWHFTFMQRKKNLRIYRNKNKVPKNLMMFYMYV